MSSVLFESRAGLMDFVPVLFFFIPGGVNPVSNLTVVLLPDSVVEDSELFGVTLALTGPLPNFVLDPPMANVTILDSTGTVDAHTLAKAALQPASLFYAVRS